MKTRHTAAALLCMAVAATLCACSQKRQEQPDSFATDNGAFHKSIEGDMAKFKV